MKKRALMTVRTLRIANLCAFHVKLWKTPLTQKSVECFCKWTFHVRA